MKKINHPSEKDVYLKNGGKIPMCINCGCNNIVSIRHWSKGLPSLKTECSSCSTNRKNNKKIDGIVYHKKQYCENKHGILGFFCPMSEKRYIEFPSDCYDMDHLDGDHHNNTLENVKTFCKVCHSRKGKENGDFNSLKPSSRKPKK